MPTRELPERTAAIVIGRLLRESRPIQAAPVVERIRFGELKKTADVPEYKYISTGPNSAEPAWLITFENEDDAKVADQAVIDIEKGDVRIHSIEYGLQTGGWINMRMSGEHSKIFIGGLFEFFIQNGGKNYLTFQVEANYHESRQLPVRKLEVTMTNCDGVTTPAQRLFEQRTLLEQAAAALGDSHPLSATIRESIKNDGHQPGEPNDNNTAKPTDDDD